MQHYFVLITRIMINFTEFQEMKWEPPPIKSGTLEETEDLDNVIEDGLSNTEQIVMF